MIVSQEWPRDVLEIGWANSPPQLVSRDPVLFLGDAQAYQFRFRFHEAESLMHCNFPLPHGV